MTDISYFLGSNTQSGFVSYFNELYDPLDNWNMFIIKGGPGTGKSSVMKAIAKYAEQNNYKVERIYCSSDPLSLDGVILPEIKTSIADGTAPHIINPVFPGVCEHMVDLGKYWDSGILKNNADSIKQITLANSDEHTKCIKYLKAAGLMNSEIEEIISKFVLYDKLDRYIYRTVKKELKDIENTDVHKSIRLLSAVTPIGINVHQNTINSLCERIISVKDDTGVISSYIMKKIAQYALTKNYNIIECRCSINSDKIDHIIIPELKLCYYTSNKFHPLFTKADITVFTDRFVDSEKIKPYRNKLAFAQKAKTDMIGESIKKLENAKATHDILENYYISAMNFKSVIEERDRLIKKIFN